MRFIPNEPVATVEPKVVVDGGLPVGRHRFRLEVMNARGQRSRPAEVTVIVHERGSIGPVPPIRGGGSRRPTRRRQPPSP